MKTGLAYGPDSTGGGPKGGRLERGQVRASLVGSPGMGLLGAAALSGNTPFPEGAGPGPIAESPEL